MAKCIAKGCNAEVGELSMTLPLNSVSLNVFITRHSSTVPQTSFARTALG